MSEHGDAPADSAEQPAGEPSAEAVEALAEQSGGGQQEPVETQDEGINTVDDGGLAAEPSVIGTYTETQPGEVEAAVQEQQEAAEAAAEAAGDGEAQPAAAEDAAAADDAAAASAQPEGSRPASAAAAASTHGGSRPASAVPAPPSRSGSVQETAAADGSRPASAVPASTPPPGSRPASAVPESAPPPGSRPASAVPAPAGSRPASAVPSATAQPEDGAPAPAGSRPASGASAPPAVSSRPASSSSATAAAAAPAADGSRPASATATAADAPASAPGSRPASGAAPPAADDPAASSRPGTSQSAVRPASSGSAAAAATTAPPAANSRPPSAQPPAAPPAPAPGSRPASAVPPPAGISAASGSSRPPSAQPPLAEQRPPSGKVQAAEQHGYVQPGTRVVDVQVDQGPGLPHRMIRVLIDLTQADAKPYLGGMRNKRTGAVYHHAFTQTPKAPRYAGVEPKLERQTQTVKISTRTQQTVREAATQMERPGVVVDTTHDRERTPGKYQTSEERLAIVEAATRTIQRWVRGWIGRKRAAVLRKHKMEREAFLQEQEMKAQQAAEEHRRREIERRMHPRTAADFEILYNELEAWRLQETRKIKEAGLPPDKQQEVLQQLLHKETKLLQTIDRLKINANLENKDMRIQRTLGDMSKPKQYELKNGKKVEVHTPFTTRAKELMQLYNGLNLPMLTIDERLDVLLHVKWTVKEFDCNLTREIVSLIDREADLLNRGRSPAMLEGLRKRIASMFLNFIETPEFNPEASRFQVQGQDFESYLFSQVEKSMAPPASVTYQRTSKWDA